MGLSYAQEKFGVAMEMLATTAGDWRSRLEAAALEFFPIILERDVPEELQSDYTWIEEQLTKVEARGDEGNLRATLAKMTESDGYRVASAIRELSAKLNAVRE